MMLNLDLEHLFNSPWVKLGGKYQQCIDIITESKGGILYSDVIVSLSAVPLHALGDLRKKPKVLNFMKRTRKYVA